MSKCVGGLGTPEMGKSPKVLADHISLKSLNVLKLVYILKGTVSMWLDSHDTSNILYKYYHIGIQINS